MTDKAKIGSGSVEIDGERYGTDTWEYAGETFTVRELSINEGDDVAEAATGPEGKFNNRANTRMLLAKALIAPATTPDGIGKFASRKYLLVLQHFNRLNSLPEEKPTLPAGSAEPTSPASGEPLPTA